MQLPFIITTMLMLYTLPAWAQPGTASQTLERIQAYYDSAEQHEYDINIAYFEDYTDATPASEVRMNVQQTGSSSYRKIENGTETLEQFFGKGISLEVDHNQRTVRYDQLSTEMTLQTPVLQAVVEMAELPGMQLKILDKNGLRLHAPGKSGTQIDLFYDPVHYRLLKISMLIEVDAKQTQLGFNGTKMICNFTYPERTATKQLSDFLVGNSAAYQLAEAYQTFTLFR
ncbi:MAG: hypothetical protein AAFO03_02340 [Bacteroidota bacterium]